MRFDPVGKRVENSFYRDVGLVVSHQAPSRPNDPIQSSPDFFDRFIIIFHLFVHEVDLKGGHQKLGQKIFLSLNVTQFPNCIKTEFQASLSPILWLIDTFKESVLPGMQVKCVADTRRRFLLYDVPKSTRNRLL